MASVKFEKGSEEWLMFQDYFQLLKNKIGSRDIRLFELRYQSIPLAMKLSEALAEYLGEVSGNIPVGLFDKNADGWKMLQDYYILVQKYYIPEDTDEYWESVIAEMDKFAKKYSSVPLARKITMAFIQTLEEESKKQRK